ncbi:hypothetical protein LOZ66_004718 [Ophidiomyces ophidiicola]|nr:hypothetical protein LOZ66_004718 [Ophidiomyces ophidiicola]
MAFFDYPLLDLSISPTHPWLDLPSSASIIVLVSIVTIVLWQLARTILGDVKAPYVGYESSWAPVWLASLLSAQQVPFLIQEGFRRYRDSMFKIHKRDSDILVISNRFVDELRSLPQEHIGAIDAHVKILLGSITGTDILLDGDLHTKALQTKLTPNLGALTGQLKAELDFSMTIELPDCEDEWVEVQMPGILRRFVARLSARAFVGSAVCRNEDWIRASITYAENIFMTMASLRKFPTFLRPLLAPFLSSYWRVQSDLSTAKGILAPIIEQRRRDQALKNLSYDKPKDLLQGMMDLAKPNEAASHRLAHRQFTLSLGSLNTTTTAAVQTLYDICDHPEYFEPLREELLGALTADGGWDKTTPNNMHGMDSFMKESQRFYPPSFLSFNRIVKKPLTLSDGTQIRRGTHFGMPSYSILQDPEIVPSPEKFDGFRYKKLREDPREVNKHQFASTDVNNLHFGHGKYACPGRFFASLIIKMIVGNLILHYDFKFPDGTRRPLNLNLDENVYPDPSAVLLMRRRRNIQEK